MSGGPAFVRDGGRARALAVGTLGNWLARGATLGFWFVATPFLVAGLGARGFAIFALVQSVVALTSILDFAIAAALTREVAADQAGNVDRARIPGAAATVLWVSVAYAAVVLAAAAGFADVVAASFSSGESREATALIIVLTAAQIAVSLPYAVLFAMLRGLRRFDLTNIATVLAGGGTALAATAVVAAGGGILAVLAVLPAVLLGVLAMGVRFVRSAAPGLSLSLSDFRLASVPPLARFAAPVLAASAAARLQTRAGEIVVGLTLPLASVTPFALARRLGEIPQHFVDQATKALLPFASELDAQADHGRLRELYLVANRLTFALLFPSAALVTVLGGSLLLVWIGEEVGDAGALVAILAFAMLLEAAQWISAAMLQAIGSHRPLAAIGTCGALASLGASLALAPRWGTFGVALGVLAATSAATVGGVFPLALRRLGLPAREMLTRAVWPAAWPVVPAALAAAAIDRALVPATWASVVLAAAAFGALYAGTFLAFAAEARERSIVRDLLRRVFRDRFGWPSGNVAAADGTIRVMNVIARLNVGGPAVQVSLVTAKMGAPDYRSMLVTGSIEEGEGDMSYYAHAWGVEPVVIPELGRSLHPVRDLVTVWRLYRLMRRFQPHVVHTNTAKAGMVGRLAARLAAVPVVIHTFHGHVFYGYFGRVRTRIFILLERIAARLSDAIVTLSEELRADLSKRYRIAPEDQITILGNGLDLQSFVQTPRKGGTFRQRFHLPPEAPLVGIVGRLTSVKNHALFLDAAARVRRQYPSARFVIVGDGELRAEIEATISALGLRDSVTITGWQRDMPAVYGDLDLLVLTSHNEGTPLTIIEALAVGVPVVATAVGGVPDLLEHGRLGRLAPRGDADALAEAIVTSLRAPSVPSSVRALIAERYGIDRLVRDLDRLYRGILARKRSKLTPPGAASVPPRPEPAWRASIRARLDDPSSR